MLKRDPERLERLRVAVRYLLEKQAMQRGHQARLAEHFQVTRQRVNQIVVEEQLRSGIVRAKRRAASFGRLEAGG